VEAEALRRGVPGLAALEELEGLGARGQRLHGLRREDLDGGDDRLDLAALGRVEAVGEPQDRDHERDVGLDRGHHVGSRRALLGDQREQAVARLGQRGEALERLEGGGEALAVTLVARRADDGVRLRRAHAAGLGCRKWRGHGSLIGREWLVWSVGHPPRLNPYRHGWTDG
jgi:hypothetical protein